MKNAEERNLEQFIFPVGRPNRMKNVTCSPNVVRSSSGVRMVGGRRKWKGKDGKFHPHGGK